ncbi:MAG TPA: alpha/beta hydrolase-fold protein [Longimicrobiales bacterium]
MPLHLLRLASLLLLVQAPGPGSAAGGAGPAAGAPRFEVSFSPAAHAGPITGRLVLLLSKVEKPEPRLLVNPRGPAMYGVDLAALAPGKSVVVDNGALGAPVSLAELPEGDYFAQAVIDVYTQVHRADGRTTWVHLNDGTVEFFSIAAGNLYSDVVPVHVGTGGVVRLALTHVIAAEPKPSDTEWLKHVTLQSQLLTKFWGHPVYIHAHVLLPRGYAQHPDVYYPSVYTLGHGSAPLSFTTTPPEAGRPTGVSPVTGLENGYETYRKWSADGFPRVICITLEQATPYFPDSYAVNSANNGPYGDAFVQEVVPYLESHFRIIPRPYARQLEGASTSGWQTLALQLQHPDFFGGAWVFQPDPIDFTRYQLTDIYADSNAFSAPNGQLLTAERCFQRTTEGQCLISTRQLSRFEAVLGSHGRSGYQLEAWEAVYGPVGADGYPVPLWDKLSGRIDHEVARYMRDHGYDLLAYTRQNWPALGPKLVGKLHFSAGDMDDYWLNLGVYRFQDFLKSTTSPHYEGEFVYGRPMKGHAWHAQTWADFIRHVGEAVAAAAPAGENTAAWHY